MRLISVFLNMIFILAICGCSGHQKFASYGLRSFEVRMNPEDLGELNAGAPEGLKFPGRILIDGEEHRMMISAAGQTSIYSPRKGYNIELRGGATLNGSHHFRLTGTPKDRSMLRALLALEVFAGAGLPHSWVEPSFFHINDRVMGVYLAIERVDGDYFGSRGLAWERIFEAEGDADFGPSFEADLARRINAKPKPEDLTPMIALRRTLDLVDGDEFSAQIFRMLERDTLVRYMAAAKISNHFDGFNKNLYYYQEPHTHLMRFAPWDFDLTWAPDHTDIADPWRLNLLFTRIGSDPGVRAEIEAKVTQLLSGDLSKAKLLLRLDHWKNRITTAYEHDPFLGKIAGSLDREAANLAAVISARIDLID